MMQLSWLTRNRLKRGGMYRMLAHRRRMEKCLAEHGSDDKRDKLVVEDWLKRNAVNVCPPFGYKSSD